jgi:two-component system OmpR family sensor kinase
VTQGLGTDARASRGFLRWIRELPGRTPLRVKLITAVLVLVAVALAIISIAGLSVIRGYQLGQADDQLQTLSSQGPHAVAAYLNGDNPGQAQDITLLWIPSGVSPHVVIAPTAEGVSSRYMSNSAPVLPGPAIPVKGSWLADHLSRPVTVPAQSGGGQWRVLITPQSFTANGQEVTGDIVVGLNVSTAYATIGKLAFLDLLLSVGIILGLAVVGIAVVRASLRPLIAIEKTAEGIAAGDLSRRVPDRDPRTEVGRLGRSLNTMLAQIETAFSARARSEYAARRSEDKMRQFVADASHELRTPLTAIRGFAEYYRQRGGASVGAGASAVEEPSTDSVNGGPQPLSRDELDRIMRRVEQESSRMGVLVEDMLLLARLDEQRALEHRPVDLLTLAADAVHDARVVAPGRAIDLTVNTGAALIVDGDEVRLRQVIGNLMSNALTHTPDGGPVRVVLRSGRMSEYPPAADDPAAARPAAILEVTDEGPGLSQEQAERIFERFYRADQARTRVAGGAGLGLAIVAALISAHQGAVWVESEPGAGATFRIALPLSPEASPGELDEPDDADDAHPDSGAPAADSAASEDPAPADSPAPGGDSDVIASGRTALSPP